MVYNEKMAEKIREIVGRRKGISERKMFGGLSFMYYQKMFCGVLKNELVLKMSHDQCEKALKGKNVRLMDFTGRPMKGFVYVNERGCKSIRELRKWVLMSFEYAKLIRKKDKLILKN